MRLVLDAVDNGAAAMSVLPDEPIRTAERGEVVVAMEWGGLNRIDVMLLEGRVSPPAGLHVLGAQGAGRISECGEAADGLAPGQLVALYPYGGCGNCARCTAGNETLCRHARLDGVNAPGMFQRHFVARAEDVFPVQAPLNGRMAAVASALAIAWHELVCRGGLRRGETVAVVSITSGLGACCGALASLLGANVVGVARQASLERLRATPSWLTQTWASDTATGTTPPPRVDLAVDAVGATTLPIMHRLVRTSGRIVTVGAHAGGDVSLDLWGIFTREQDLRGSHGCHRSDMAKALTALGEVNESDLVDSTFPLTDHASAYRRLDTPGRLGNVLLDLRDQPSVAGQYLPTV